MNVSDEDGDLVSFSSDDELMMGLASMKDATFRVFIKGTNTQRLLERQFDMDITQTLPECFLNITVRLADRYLNARAQLTGADTGDMPPPINGLQFKTGIRDAYLINCNFALLKFFIAKHKFFNIYPSHWSCPLPRWEYMKLTFAKVGYLSGPF